MELFLFICLILLLVWIGKVSSRVGRLEKLFKVAQAASPVQTPAKPVSSPEVLASQSPKPGFSPEPILPVTQEPDWSQKFMAWLKEDWLLKLGALLLLMGFGWLVSYAFLHNWIGPVGRILLGIIAGVVILLVGWWRIKQYLHQGSIFLVLGSTIILLTIFAAREIYSFLNPFSALLVMFLSTAFVALASVRYNHRTLAVVSLVLAGLAPLLTNAPKTDYVGLFSYLLVVVLGAIWIVALRAWRPLTTAGLLLVALYSLPHLYGFTSSDKGALLVFAYVFAAVFFFSHTLGVLKLRDKEVVPDLITAGGNGLLLLAWIMTAAPDEWKSLLIAAWMVVFAVGAFFVFRITQNRAAFYVYAGVGLAMLAAATAAELHGAALTIAFTIETSVVIGLVYFILRDIHLTQHFSWLLLVPVFLSFSSIISPAWNSEVLHKDFFVLLLLAFSLFVLGFCFRQILPASATTEDAVKLYGGLFVVGSLYAYVIVWLSLHAAFIDDDKAVMVALLIYTIAGLVNYFYGRKQDNKNLRVYGGLVLGFVVIRLLLVDVWKMQLTGKIITFFLVGTLLVSTAFFSKKKTSDLPTPLPKL